MVACRGTRRRRHSYTQASVRLANLRRHDTPTSHANVEQQRPPPPPKPPCTHYTAQCPAAAKTRLARSLHTFQRHAVGPLRLVNSRLLPPPTHTLLCVSTYFPPLCIIYEQVCVLTLHVARERELIGQLLRGERSLSAWRARVFFLSLTMSQLLITGACTRIVHVQRLAVMLGGGR